MVTTSFQIQPTHFDTNPEHLVDLTTELSIAATRLEVSVPAPVAHSLSNLVRYMNCYYTNQIERSITLPRDIERSVIGDLSNDRTPNLFEARRHVEIQAWIDERFRTGTLPEPASQSFLKEIHARFFEGAPEQLLVLQHAGRRVTMQPGCFRTTPEEDNEVGRHLPPASEKVAEFMSHFEEQYRITDKRTTRRILDFAASHHRLLWIHPFLDGNGRVTRLMSHALAYHAGIGAHGLWSIARGLARSLDQHPPYKDMVRAADELRRSDLDGRGHLSQAALANWCEWFLAVALDQVTFMTRLFDLTKIDQRFETYIRIRSLRDEAFDILAELARKGTLTRGDAARRSGLKERSARDLIHAMLEDGIISSPSVKGQLTLNITIDSSEVLFPNLFPASA